MENKEIALKQLDNIYKTMQDCFRVIVPANRMLATGLMITLIPGIEYILSTFVDPKLFAFGFNSPMIFMLRTIFYWSIFVWISKFFQAKDRECLHPGIKEVLKLGILFPLIPISTAGMLALVGQTALIMPMVLILIGSFWLLFGRFSSYIISIIAVAYIIAGLVGIYLSKFNIDNLWIYLLIFQGLGCIIMGACLKFEQRNS